MEIFTSFGIEGKLLLWQVINFGLLLGVLWYFLYKPLRKIMLERENKIRESLNTADELKKKSMEMEQDFSVKFEAQQKEMRDLHARELAEQESMRKEMRERGAEEAQAMIMEGRKAVKTEQDKMMSSMESEIKGLAVALASKIIHGKMNSEVDNSLVDQAFKALKDK